jgi:type I restriction enzyme R subunit
LEKNVGAIFDSVIAVTDRKVLDKQIKDIIKQFTQVGGSAKAKRAIANPQWRIP